MLSKEKRQQILKITGIACIAGVLAGALSLHFSGATESTVVALVGGVFVFIGIILNVLDV